MSNEVVTSVIAIEEQRIKILIVDYDLIVKELKDEIERLKRELLAE